MIAKTLASVCAGSIGGVVGVFVSFPLDTIKTKTQVRGRLPLSKMGQEVGASSEKVSMCEAASLILQEDGLSGFYFGVRPMMVGQASIKAVAFTVNLLVLHALIPYRDLLPHVTILLIAAFTAGLAASFIVTPVERIKVMMQANGKVYSSGIQCIRSVVAKEGWCGLFTRGLRITMAREIPSDGVYFALYGYLSQSQLATYLGSAAPLVFGAAAGCASWCPVYPIDCVKTVLQNTEGGSEICSWEIAVDIYKNKGGVLAFYNGFTAKMMRAAVFHSMTFFAYEVVLDILL